MIFSAGLQFTLAPINVALPVYAPLFPLGGGFAIGLLYSAFFTGMAIGSLLIARSEDIIATHRGRIIVGGLPVFGICLGLAVVQIPDTNLQIAAVSVY